MADRSEAEQVGLRFLTSAFRLRRVVDRHMMASGLSLARAKALQVLDQQGPLRQASLAAELDMAARSVTQAVEALERDGLVERTADPTDRRAKVVVITEDGAAALAAGLSAGERVLQGVFDALGPEQLETLNGLLATIDERVTTA
ncbi:MarR family transcriptional regulator [Nonomuraea angiospora]|uniref:MarR family winged helix-turn-helix transcriptional regulator n=1 Tax=Nonomuraea angiospora TaxID=46172 RepID=UPI003418DF2D